MYMEKNVLVGIENYKKKYFINKSNTNDVGI